LLLIVSFVYSSNCAKSLTNPNIFALEVAQHLTCFIGCRIILRWPWSITCHMWDHTVLPATQQVNVPHRSISHAV